MFRKVLLVAYRAFSDLTAKGAFFLVTIVAARRLSPVSFGVFSLASALGWMVAVATDFGIQLHVARAVARRPERASVILRAWLTVRLWSAGVALVVVAGGLLARPPESSYGFPILLFTLLYVSNGLLEFLHYFYRGLARSDVESTLTLAHRAVTLACALAVLTWHPTLTPLAVAMLSPSAITLAFSGWYAARLGRAAANVDSRSSPSESGRTRWSELRRDVLPIGAGIVLSALYFRIDIFLIQLWKGADLVGTYNAVFRLVEALRLFPAAVLAVMLPSMCRAGDKRPLVQVSLAVTSFAIAATLILWAGAGWVIPLVYGVRYAAAVPAFRILLLSFPLFSLNYALTHQLIAWDGQRAYAAICGAALVANLGLNARLIPALSIDGAAWATLFTEVLLTAGCLLALWVHSPRRVAGAFRATAAS